MTLLVKIPSCTQVRAMDSFTIEHEPVLSIDLMERAAGAVAQWMMNHFPPDVPFCIVAGPGNNGGDGLAVARILHHKGYCCRIYVLDLTSRFSADHITNRLRIEQSGLTVEWLREGYPMPVFQPNEIIVDALFGSGLSKPVVGYAAEVIRCINQSGCKIIAIDIPSGLFGEDNTCNHAEAIVRAGWTLTFQFPKLSFFFPENECYTGQWIVIPIGLHPAAIEQCVVDYFWLTPDYVRQLIRPRKKFAHKGHFGHALLVAGSRGKMGAAILGAKACMRAGAGLLTVHLPSEGYPVIQQAIPEAMCSIDANRKMISEIPLLPAYTAAAVGPGIGTQPATAKALYRLIRSAQVPLVIDADGINLLAADQQMQAILPEGTILTPHPKEWERLAGKTANSYHRLLQQQQFARKHSVIVVLKGAYTTIAFPDGKIFFNSTGNPGMATGGSGDVLTGMILSFLAQGYGPANAAILGVYLHGLAGDLARKKTGEAGLMAGDIADHAGLAMESLLDLAFVRR